MTEPDPPRITVEAVGGTSRRVLTVIAVISAGLAILTLKPWDSRDESLPDASLPLAVAAMTSSPELITSPEVAAGTHPPATEGVPDELAAARGRALCGSEPEWRLLTMETGPLGTSRTLYSDVPAIATGPADEAIPTVAVTAPQLLGIGVCRPGGLDQRDATTPVTGVTIWNVSAQDGPLMVTGIAVIDPDLSRLGEAYFRPRSSDGSTPETQESRWEPGHYAIEIAAGAPDGQPLWLALDYLAS